jgi:hypothetical protein
MLLWVLLSVLFGAMAVPALAQDITSDIRVVVSDEAGNRVEDVDIRITHIPTQRSQTIASNAVGLVTARGLQIGGPYRVESADASRFAAETLDDIYLVLGDTSVIDLVVRDVSGQVVEEVVVLGQQAQEGLRYGVGTDFQEDFIRSIPSISRDFISTLATDPQVLVDTSVARGPAVSVAGGNYRYNSVTIDGVPQNDNFGLSKNASATQRTPISIDAVEALSVNVAPYDVTYGNFVGGNINVVTKSGTNEFHGSVYAFRTDDGWSGEDSKGLDLGIQAFSEDVYGGTFGGPIIKDQLFFFVAYEKFESDRPSNTQTIDDIVGVTQADVDAARSIFQSEYGFDPGPFATTDTDEDEKILLKLDWFINDNHRAVISYQEADGDVLFDDFPEAAILQSNRYDINEKLEAYSFHLFSDWNDRFSTELKLGSKKVENRQISAGVGPSTPDFAVFTNAGGLIGAGGDRFRHANELDNDSDVFKLKADYELGQHTLTAGWEKEEYTIRNEFLPFSKAQYTFLSLEALQNRDVGFVLYGNSNTGVAKDAETNFTLTVDSFYLQDEFAATDDLTLKFGLRYDTYSNDDPVVANPAFLARRGFSNTENLDGKDLVSPRFGFNWTPTDRLTIRGGAGLFGGGTPLIMLSNSYAGNGVTRTFAAFLAPFFGPPVSDSIAAAVADLPDPTAAFENFQQYIGFNPAGDVDAIDPDFDILSTWKYSLGFDYDADLPFLGEGWIISGEWIHTEVKDGYDIDELNRSVIGTAPDGRPLYDFPAGGDYVVTNTSEGGGDVYTLNFAKNWDTNSGLYDLTFGYTHQDLDEVRSYNRFVGFETYAMDPQTDLNNPLLAPSRYQTEDRLTATFNWQQQLFGDNTTAISLVYTGRSGLHYSPVMGSANAAFGGTFLADFGSEADNPGSQLFYVPTGVNDPLVTGDPHFLNHLDAYINAFDCLRGQRGQIAGRNSCESGWVNLWNLRFLQEFRFRNEHALELTLDIENLGNLINDDWGRVQNFTAPSNVALANVAISGDGAQYIYSPIGVVNSADDVAPRPAIARLPSVYRIQLGLRYRF